MFHFLVARRGTLMRALIGEKHGFCLLLRDKKREKVQSQINVSLDSLGARHRNKWSQFTGKILDDARL